MDILPAEVPKLITIHFIRVEVDGLCAFSKVKSFCSLTLFHVTCALKIKPVMLRASKCTFF